jgi:polar amino acid transport system substrate-binding protein
VTKPVPTIEPGALMVGVDASAPLPLHSDLGSAGFEGFEVDLLSYISGRLGLRVSYRSALWSEITVELLDRRIDLICTAATVTPERKTRFDFGRPYLDTELAIVVPERSEIRSLEGLQGKALGVRIATVAEDFVREHARAGSFRTYHMNTEAYRALQRGEIEAVIERLAHRQIPHERDDRAPGHHSRNGGPVRDDVPQGQR